MKCFIVSLDPLISISTVVKTHKRPKDECVCSELTRVRMLLARSAYVSVLRDSSKATEAGLIWAIMTVRLFPPNESCQSKASEEKQYVNNI